MSNKSKKGTEVQGTSMPEVNKFVNPHQDALNDALARIESVDAYLANNPDLPEAVIASLQLGRAGHVADYEKVLALFHGAAREGMVNAISQENMLHAERVHAKLTAAGFDVPNKLFVLTTIARDSEGNVSVTTKIQDDRTAQTDTANNARTRSVGTGKGAMFVYRGQEVYVPTFAAGAEWLRENCTESEVAMIAGINADNRNHRLTLQSALSKGVISSLGTDVNAPKGTTAETVEK